MKRAIFIFLISIFSISYQSNAGFLSGAYGKIMAGTYKETYKLQEKCTPVSRTEIDNGVFYESSCDTVLAVNKLVVNKVGIMDLKMFLPEKYSEKNVTLIAFVLSSMSSRNLHNLTMSINGEYMASEIIFELDNNDKISAISTNIANSLREDLEQCETCGSVFVTMGLNIEMLNKLIDHNIKKISIDSCEIPCDEDNNIRLLFKALYDKITYFLYTNNIWEMHIVPSEIEL